MPRETACFACHTDYTLYGDYKAKLRGLRHVWVQYVGTIPAKITLYTPYNNRECLHCHDGARSFVEAVTHKSEPGRLIDRSNRKSCLTAGATARVHDVAHVDALAAVAQGDEMSDADARAAAARLGGAGDARPGRRARQPALAPPDGVHRLRVVGGALMAGGNVAVPVLDRFTKEDDHALDVRHGVSLPSLALR